MKKLLLALLLIPSICFAKTARVEYDFADFTNYSVIVWVSETPGIEENTQMWGQQDNDENGIVEIGNIYPGKTYYFRARAYNKTTGIPTDWSAEISKDVPSELLPTPQALPEIIIPSFPGFIIQSITIIPVE